MTRPHTADRPVAPHRLAELLADRARWVGRTPQDADRDDPAAVTALVVLRAVDLTDLVTGARSFAAGLTAGEADAWRSSWTRTRFLFGNPVNLTERSPARVVAPGGSAAWLGPVAAARPSGPGRLLKPVTGVLPPAPDRLDLPAVTGPGAELPVRERPVRELYVAVDRLPLPDYLVHLHHSVAEAVLMGRLAGTEALRLVHVPEIGAAIARGVPSYARVQHDRATGRLRLFTWLTGPAASRSEFE
jgi:hypothetical protein